MNPSRKLIYQALGLTILFSTIAIGFFSWGAISVQKQYFPFKQIQTLRSVLYRGYLYAPVPRNILFQIFKPQSDIVMIGDSITANALVPWNELVSSDKRIANAGVGGDKTTDVLARLETVFEAKPKIAFLMVGTNDFNVHAEPKAILENYIVIIKSLMSRGVDVYVQSTLECEREKCGNQKLADLRMLNKILMKYCIENDINFIDINKKLATENDGLSARYSDGGVHLSAEGYAQWARELQPYFNSFQ